MRVTASDHLESIQTTSTQLWSTPKTPNAQAFRPALNLSLLIQLLQSAVPDLANVQSSSKRKIPGVQEGTRASKRARTSGNKSAHVGASNGSAVQNVFLDPPSPPSNLMIPSTHPSPHELVHIIHHSMKIQYTKRDANSMAIGATQLSHPTWQEQDEELLARLGSICDSGIVSSNPVDLGRVDLVPFGDRWVAVTPEDSPLGAKKWVLLVPSLSIDAASNGYKIPTQDLLSSIHYLGAESKRPSRAIAQARIKALFPSSFDPDCPRLPIALHLDLTVSVHPPTLLRASASTLGTGTPRGQISTQDAQRRVLRVGMGLEDVMSNVVRDPINVFAFYSIMQPAPILLTEEADTAMQPAALEATLLPFQRRSVAWLLSREGKAVTPDGRIVDREEFEDFTFWTRYDEGNQSWWINRLSGEVLQDQPDPPPPIYGAILAEEPGLGKTLETIALILLNPAPPERNPTTMSHWDADHRLDIKAVKTTLIVTPPSLARQWKEEIEKHAPSLKLFIYDGWTKCPVPITNTPREIERATGLAKKVAKAQKARRDTPVEEQQEERDMTRDSTGKLLEWPEYVQQFDIVIVTYPILRADLGVAKPAPERPRREDVVYSSVGRARSPLVMVEWTRVVMDEVQMAAGAKSEEMVSLIPRLSSLAVSGTPSKSHLPDLYQVFKFLQIDQIIGSMASWKRLLLPAFSDEFAAFLQQTAKASVNQELTIPKQTRYLVGVELGRVERHVYDQALEGILLDLGLDARGVAATENWQVGQLQKKDGLIRAGALKTMEAVLESMKEQNWRNLMDDHKAKLVNLVRDSRLRQRNEANERRHIEALETLVRAEKETLRHLEDLQTALTEHKARGVAMKEEAARLRQERGQTNLDDVDQDNANDSKGKGKARQDAMDVDIDDEAGIPKTLAGEEYSSKLLSLNLRIREVKLILHQIKFLQGDIHHVLANSPEEDASYGAAENLRREFLKAPEEDANRAVVSLQSSAARKNIAEEEIHINIPFIDGGGIRTAYLFDELNQLIENVLNEQGRLLWEWRTHILDLLTKPLNAGEEADGQEYQRSLDDQGEAEAYLQVYAALLADRREALSNERTLLAAHDAQEKRLRKTKAAIKAANTAAEALLEIGAEVEIQPEHEVLHKELSTKRKALIQELKGRAVRSILVDITGAAARVGDKDPERLIIKSATDAIRKLINAQNLLHDKIEADLTLIRKAFNHRILYFRQLQEISDSVADVMVYEGSLAQNLAACAVERAELEGNINRMRARDRYLDNLRSTSAEDQDDEDKACILCRCDFVRGYITQCAHIFCEDCMKLWMTRQDGKTCPVCRVMVQPDTVQRFTVNTQVAEPAPEIKRVAGELDAIPQSHRKIEYNMIDPKIVADINTIETLGDFGSKIQALVRHILYIKFQDPHAKSIVFSAWADSLQIVEVALRSNGIRSIRVDKTSAGRGGKSEPGALLFRNDPSISVLLLHGERENAGLNVTCASRVFLLESVVHHSFELQAIARIDRLGQKQETEVYCYYAEDTVEKNILDLAARKGLSLYTKDNAVGTVNISSFVQHEHEPHDIDDLDKKEKSTQRGDFIFKVDDMLAILFPHMFEDMQYLLDDTAMAQTDDVDVEMQDINGNNDSGHPVVSLPANPRPPRRGESPPVAGPSRLR